MQNVSVPSPPTNISVKAKSKSSVKLEWDFPETSNSKLIKNYVIEYGFQDDIQLTKVGIT